MTQIVKTKILERTGGLFLEGISGRVKFVCTGAVCPGTTLNTMTPTSHDVPSRRIGLYTCAFPAALSN